MSKPIHLTVQGRDRETDAPTVQDLLAQVSDWVAILRGVEQAIAEDGTIEIEWRVTDAKKESPLAIELTAFSRQYGMDIENRVRQVKEQTSIGLATLRKKAERPSYFTDHVLEKAEHLFERVTNGLALTRIDFDDEFPAVEIKPNEARLYAANAIAVRKPKEKPYEELGSLEGTLHGVERDGWGRAIIFVKLRMNGETIKCVASESARVEVERHQIGDVWKNRRIRVFGKIYYKSLGRVAQIESDTVQFLRSKKDLPNAREIVNEKFTGGLSTKEYLERLRNGKLS